MGRAVDVTIDNGAPITLVSQLLGHVDLKTTRVYAHARPNESSSRYLKTSLGYATLTTRRLRPRHCTATIDDCPTHHWEDPP